MKKGKKSEANKITNKKTNTSKQKNKKNNKSSTTKKNKKKQELIDSDDDSDEDYEVENDDSEKNGTDEGEDEVAQINKSEEEESNDGDEDDVDSDVEREIRQALKLDNKKKKVISTLHSVSWFRIICDEAHMIKDRSTSTAKAVFNLISLHKWCLTGTPLQNRVGELYSLIRFLRVDPYAYYYCKSKNCSCKSLHYVRFTNINILFTINHNLEIFKRIL